MSRVGKRGQPFGPRSKARRRALQALYQWEITRQPAGDIVRQFRDEQDMTHVDVDFFEALLRRVVDDVADLDRLISAHLDREIARVDPLELSALRLGTCELKHWPEVPFRVVIDECVKLAAAFGSPQAATYVNAVLDRCANDLRETEYAATK